LYANHPIGRLYWWAIIARVLATLWFAGMIVWDMFVTSRDPVRAHGVDDPAGGEFDGAPDANWRRLFRPGAHAGARTLDG
jgi:hypothetical protein